MDSHLEIQVEKERSYWRKVLKRIVAVVKFFSQRRVAFRGENEVLGSSNNRNFLGIIELLAQFDPFLADRLKRFNSSEKGNVSYLLSTTCNELIVLMAKNVTSQIISDVRTAKYFAISVDSTHDIGHVD